MPDQSEDLDYLHVKGNVIGEDHRKLINIGDSQGITLPPWLIKLLKTKGVIYFDVKIIQEHGLLGLVLTPSIKIETPEEETE